MTSSVPKTTREFAALEAMLAHARDDSGKRHWPGLRKGMPFARVVVPALMGGQQDAQVQARLKHAIATVEIDPFATWRSLAKHSGPMYSMESRQTQLAWATLVSMAAPDYIPKMKQEQKEWAELVSLAWSSGLMSTTAMIDVCQRHACIWHAAMREHMTSVARLNVLLPLRGMPPALACDAYRVWSSGVEQDRYAWETLSRHHPEWCARLVEVAQLARVMGLDEQNDVFSHALTTAMHQFTSGPNVHAAVALPEVE